MKTSAKMVAGGIGLLAAGAATKYFFTGPRGERNRQKIADWATGFKDEVVSQLKELKDVNQQAFNRTIDNTAQRYTKVKSVSAEELKHVSDDLKSAWTHISKELVS